MTTQEQVDDFYRFACEQVSHEGSPLTMDEIYSIWRAHRPTPEEMGESVAAVNAAFTDFIAGDRGEPARESLRTTCAELGLVIDQ